MVVLNGKDDEQRLLGQVPRLALGRARELGGAGVTVLVLEKGDDVCKDFRFLGRYGLLTYIDDHYQAPFTYVRFVVESGRRIFEALLAPSERYLLVVPDEDWVDHRLQVVLDVEGEELALAAEIGHAEICPVLREAPEEDRTGEEFANRLLPGVETQG